MSRTSACFSQTFFYNSSVPLKNPAILAVSPVWNPIKIENKQCLTLKFHIISLKRQWHMTDVENDFSVCWGAVLESRCSEVASPQVNCSLWLWFLLILKCESYAGWSPGLFQLLRLLLFSDHPPSRPMFVPLSNEEIWKYQVLSLCNFKGVLLFFFFWSENPSFLAWLFLKGIG